MLDCAIIGAGPAGLTAGLYTTRGGLKNVTLFETGMPGGQITQSSEIENYPGIKNVVTGMELMECWPEQCSKFGLKTVMGKVIKIEKDIENNIFNILLENKTSYKAKSVFIATGSLPKKSYVKGEKEFFGRGVGTCATCDGFFYKNKEVAVLGGGETALEEAVYLANICKKVYIIHRRDNFRASPSNIERVKNKDNIELILNSTVDEIYGDDMGVNGLKIKNLNSNQITDIKVPGVFVFVGRDVQTDILKNSDNKYICQLSESGEVIVDLKMQTSLKGLFAGGDIRINSAKQVICAAGDGATAGVEIVTYIQNLG